MSIKNGVVDQGEVFLSVDPGFLNIYFLFWIP